MTGEKTGPLPPVETLDALCSFIEANITTFDAVIISDYCKGVICAPLMDHLRRLVSLHQVPMIVDPKPIHTDLFHGGDHHHPQPSRGGKDVRGGHL